MALSFLCKNHRAWLSQHPEDAMQSCVSTCEAGWMLYQQGRWQEALPYVGSAFQTAEILLSNRVIMPGSAMEWFLHTLAGLIQTLKTLNHIDACKEFYQTAIDRLKQERMNNPGVKTAIDAQIRRLTHERWQLNVNGKPDMQRGQPFANNQHAMVLH
jgi:hypothetical protein